MAVEPSQLMGVGDIAAMCGVTRPAVVHWRERYGFPEPVTRISSGPVWVRDDVAAWLEGHQARRRKTRAETAAA